LPFGGACLPLFGAVPQPAIVADDCFRSRRKFVCKVQSNAHSEIKVRNSVAFTYEASETSMSIGSIANIFQQYPLGMIGGTNPSSGAGTTSGPLQSNAPGAAQSPPAGGLFDALMQALTQSGALTSTTAATSAAGTSATSTTTDAKATSAIGAGATSASDTSSTAASGTQTPQQAMQAFIQNLVSALQSQQTGTASAATPSSPDPTASTGAAVAGAHGHHGHGGHGGHMSAALQDLIDEVDTPNSSTTTAGATTATSNSSVASLQQSFQNLVSTMGGSANASLSGFLTNFASDLSGMNAVGNLVNTQA
jgi:hypothetical protein